MLHVNCFSCKTEKKHWGILMSHREKFLPHHRKKGIRFPPETFQTHSALARALASFAIWPYVRAMEMRARWVYLPRGRWKTQSSSGKKKMFLYGARASPFVNGSVLSFLGLFSFWLSHRGTWLIRRPSCQTPGANWKKILAKFSVAKKRKEKKNDLWTRWSLKNKTEQQQ